ncbi:MAG: metallophosphoesterase [Thermoanaerobacteraceae bacterium]|nr:metallophosphoesterase [Thermoanaerobacteraceae bacterium]
MKLFVVSDTHGILKYVRNYLKQVDDIDYIIHLGDYYTDAETLSKEFNIPTKYVYGNCDFADKDKADKIIEICGKKILLTHGHRYHVKFEKDTIIIKAKESKVDAVFFGHTHIPMISKHSDILLLNPGSASMPRGGSNRSAAVVSIENNEIIPQIINLDEIN